MSPRRFCYRRVACLAALAVTLPLLSRPASADPVILASLLIQSAGGHSADAGDGTGRFTFMMTPTATIRLFEQHVISEATVGATFVANPANDPHFAEFAKQMTNGVGNYIEWLFGPAAGGGGGIGAASEAALFGLGGGVQDFHGHIITSFALHVTGFSSGPDPTTPNFTAQTFTGRLDVLGNGTDTAPVPEPATLTLLTTGALGVFGAWRRNRRLAH